MKISPLAPKVTNVTWSKDGHEKHMQFKSRKEAWKAADNPIYWPNEIQPIGMLIVVSDAQTGEELKSITIKH